MKVQVFLSICLVAISLSYANANCCGCGCGCGGGGGNPPVTVSPPITTVAPGTTCDGFLDLENLIIQILNIVCYILNNIGTILTAIGNAPTGNTLLADLRDIINELINQVTILLSSPNLSDPQSVTLQGLIRGILNRLVALLQSILGGGTTYICTNSGGLQCTGVATIISALQSLLTNLWSQDYPNLLPVLNQILGLLNNALGELL